MLISHFGGLSGEAAAQYLKDARAAARTLAELVLTSHARGKAFEEILAACTEKFYVCALPAYQPVEVFQSNMRAMIPRLIEETENRAREKERDGPRS